MNKIILVLFILLSSCGQDFNSNSGDAALEAGNGIDTSTPAGERLSAAYDVLKGSCMNCHTNYHSSWVNFKSDSAWVSAGLAVRGDPNSSEIYSRLKNNGGDMPLGAPQISESEREALENWILNL